MLSSCFAKCQLSSFEICAMFGMFGCPMGNLDKTASPQGFVADSSGVLSVSQLNAPSKGNRSKSPLVPQETGSLVQQPWPCLSVPLLGSRLSCVTTTLLGSGWGLSKSCDQGRDGWPLLSVQWKWTRGFSKSRLSKSCL